METAIAAVLEPVGEGLIALEKVDIDATLNGLLSETVVSQTYRNLEQVNIEAVYTFPLPLNAVLLELTLELNGETLTGVVQGNAQAEAAYEDAIDEGDSAVLLQKLEPGLFTLNVGNIQPNETAVVRIKYAQLHDWQGNQLRLHIPTVIAPRYGDPAAAGLAPHQIPEYSLTNENGFSLTVRIEGDLAHADCEFPSHPVAISMCDGTKEVRLAGGYALMDRDFVLVLTQQAKSSGHGLWAPDGDGYAVLASFHPEIPTDAPTAPKNIKLVVDCSGSMGGDSIAQAKLALQEILTLLEPHDFFNIIAFGSWFNLLFQEPVVANALNITSAREYVGDIMDANLGGTEIGAALEAAYMCGSPPGVPADVLLITDGEVWNAEDTFTRAKQSKHRIFTVGVGSSVSEGFVQTIAERTGAACELVSRQENMSKKIVRHFQRIDQPRADSVSIEWPCPVTLQSPEHITTAYAGDTIHVFAWSDQVPSGEVSLRLTLADGRSVEQQVRLTPSQSEPAPSTANLPRVAAHSRIDSMNEIEAQELAVKYQLVTHLTSCVLVHVRSDERKEETIPALRKVPQTLAAGWGGLGNVSVQRNRPLYAKSIAAPTNIIDSCSNLASVFKDSVNGALSSRRQAGAKPAKSWNILEGMSANLNARYSKDRAAKLDIETLRQLADLGLRLDIYLQLRDMVRDEVTERDVVIAFLCALAASDQGKTFSRHTRRAIRMAKKASDIDELLVASISSVIEQLEPIYALK